MLLLLLHAGVSTQHEQPPAAYHVGCRVNVHLGASLVVSAGGVLEICGSPETFECTPGFRAGAEPGCTALPPVASNATTNPEYAEDISHTITNPTSSMEHVVDGTFTGWKPCGGGRRRLAPRTNPYMPAGCETCAGRFEWCDIVPAVGRFT
jgi:hypothetical protein